MICDLSILLPCVYCYQRLLSPRAWSGNQKYLGQRSISTPVSESTNLGPAKSMPGASKPSSTFAVPSPSVMRWRSHAIRAHMHAVEQQNDNLLTR